MTKTILPIAIDIQTKKELEKRAKTELMSVEELIADILRRSVLSYRGLPGNLDKVDDSFLTYFTRKPKSRRRLP